MNPACRARRACGVSDLTPNLPCMDEQQQYGTRVAAEVRAELARQGVQVGLLAIETRIPVATLSRRLNGHFPFDVEQLAAIADYLSVPVAKFLPDLETAGAA